jgi:hypothetical protein
MGDEAKRCRQWPWQNLHERLSQSLRRRFSAPHWQRRFYCALIGTAVAGIVADGVLTWWFHWPRHATETYLAANLFGVLGAAAGLVVALLQERRQRQKGPSVE